MWMTDDYIEIGHVDLTLIDPVKKILEEHNWEGKEYDRYEVPLVGGKLVVLPYLIYRPNQINYTTDQLKLVTAVKPIINSIMNHFPGYIKVRGELATLPPGAKLKLHYDNMWFHENCRRIHVPILTNALCQQIFEDRTHHLEYSKIYEINNRIFHSASNNSNSHRVHLILDLLDEGLYNSIDQNISKLLEEVTL